MLMKELSQVGKREFVRWARNSNVVIMERTVEGNRLDTVHRCEVRCNNNNNDNNNKNYGSV